MMALVADAGSGDVEMALQRRDSKLPAGSIWNKGADESADGERAEARRALRLSWFGVSFRVREKQILRGVAGSAEPGEVLAVMGPSGSGKTSLLDFLAGKVDPSRKHRVCSGSVLLNGRPRDSATFSSVAAYVQQQDSLVGVLTVRETLECAASFSGVPLSRVDDVIDRVGLRSAEGTRVGNIFLKGLSGGQMRRLSVAEQLLREPSLLLLDEPTSGLDSASALAVMGDLRSVARRDGCTVVATVHQPSSELWSMFDKVCFLVDGEVVYIGAGGAEVVGYFARAGLECPVQVNPADFIVSLINKDFPGHVDTQQLVKRWKEEGSAGDSADITEETSAAAPANPGAAEDLGRTRRAPFAWRLKTLLVRDLRELIRDPGIIGVRLAMYTMLSLLIGAMFWNLGDDYSASSIQARTGLLFYVAAFMVFMSVAVIPFFMIQREVFTKERCNGAYGVPEYVISKFLTSLPGVLLLSVVTTGIVVGMVGLNGFGIYCLDLFLSLLMAEALMCLMAALVPHFIIGIALAAGMFGFFMLCEGFFRVKSEIPDYLIWGYYMAPHTYSFRVFMYNEFSSIESFNSPMASSGSEVLRQFEMDGVDTTTDLVGLGAYAVGFQLCFACALHVLHTGKR